MSKKKNNDKVYVKSVNLGTLFLGLLLTVLAIFAYTFLLNDTLAFEDFKLVGATQAETTAYVNKIMHLFESTEDVSGLEISVTLFSFIIGVFLSVMMLVTAINVIRLFLGTFGFFGKGDSRKRALKLAKHARITFGVCGTVIIITGVCSLDDGVLPENIMALWVVSAIACAVYYLLVRYYRWFVVEKKPVSDWIFPLVHDLACFALPAVFFLVVANPAAYQQFKSALLELSLLSDAVISGYQAPMLAAMVKVLFAIGECLVLFCAFSSVKAMMKFLPFDNYKRSAGGKISNKFLWAAIFLAVMVVNLAVMATFIGNDTFDADVFLSYLMPNLQPVIMLITFTIGAKVLNMLGDHERVKKFENVKLLIPAPVAVEAEVIANDEVKDEAQDKTENEPEA